MHLAGWRPRRMTYRYKFPLYWGADKKDLGYFKLEIETPISLAAATAEGVKVLDTLRAAWGDEVSIGTPEIKTFR